MLGVSIYNIFLSTNKYSKNGNYGNQFQTATQKIATTFHRNDTGFQKV